jgi:hypothetical protein
VAVEMVVEWSGRREPPPSTRWASAGGSIGVGQTFCLTWILRPIEVGLWREEWPGKFPQGWAWGRLIYLSDGYEVQASALGTAAGAARAAADSIARLHPDQDLSRAATAMPATQVTGAVTQLAATWTHLLTTWQARVHEYARQMDASAAAYRAQEGAAGKYFRLDGRLPL